MELQNLKVRVAHQGQTLFKVFTYFLVNSSYRLTITHHTNLRIGVIHIRNTQILVAGLSVIVLTEQVHQHEVGIGTAYQGLSLTLFQFYGGCSALFFYGLEGRIGIGNSRVIATPPTFGRIVRCHIGNRFPSVGLIKEPIGAGILVFVCIVRHVFCHH